MQYPSFLPVNGTVKNLKRATRLGGGGERKNFATTALLNSPLVFQKLQFVLGQHPMINQTIGKNVFQANSVHKEYKNSLRKEGTEKTTLEN